MFSDRFLVLCFSHTSSWYIQVHQSPLCCRCTLWYMNPFSTIQRANLNQSEAKLLVFYSEKAYTSVFKKHVKHTEGNLSFKHLDFIMALPSYFSLLLCVLYVDEELASMRLIKSLHLHCICRLFSSLAAWLQHIKHNVSPIFAEMISEHCGSHIHWNWRIWGSKIKRSKVW